LNFYLRKIVLQVKHHLICFNNIFSNNELISNRFAVFVTCTHMLTYLWNRLMIDFYLCVYDRVCKVPRVPFNICVCERKLIFLCRVLSFIFYWFGFPVWRKRCISRTMMEWLTLKWSTTLLSLRPPLCMPTACHPSGMVNFRRTIPNQ
jgi:hypothetical protein